MDPFDILGLEPTFALDREALDRRYRDLQRTLHPDKHVQATAGVRRESLARAVDVNEAYRTLKDDVKRGEALLKRHGGAPDASEPTADPAFLMEVMELREALSEARVSGDLAAARKLGEQATRELTDARERLEAQLEGAGQGDAAAREAAATTLGRMRYFKRLKEEVTSIEEEGEALD